MDKLIHRSDGKLELDDPYGPFLKEGTVVETVRAATAMERCGGYIDDGVRGKITGDCVRMNKVQQGVSGRKLFYAEYELDRPRTFIYPIDTVKVIDV